MKTIKSSRIWP